MQSSETNAKERGETSLHVAGGGGLRLYFVDRACEAELPSGFETLAWRPEPESRVELGRGGACVIAWGEGRAFWRPLRRGGALGRIFRDAYLSTARLRNEMVASSRLARAGLRVARPIVGRAERAGWRWRLGLVSEVLPGETLASALDDAQSASARRKLLREAGRVVARMHATGFHHPDLHPGNLFVLSADDRDGERIAILDLTGGRWIGSADDPRLFGSLVRCARWWHKHRGRVPSARDASAFLQGYCAARKARHGLMRRAHAALLRQLRRRRRQA